jgi:hypothetical protein
MGARDLSEIAISGRSRFASRARDLVVRIPPSQGGCPSSNLGGLTRGCSLVVGYKVRDLVTRVRITAVP